MKVYRLARAAHAGFDGEGARLYPGRWNAEGIPCVYTSSSPSLAQLEVMVNHDDWTIFERFEFRLLTIEVDEFRILKFQIKDLPSVWRSQMVTESTQEFGSTILHDHTKIGFAVPSVVTPQEYNVVLNPLAQNFAEYVRVVVNEKFTLDNRLL
jgi:RES domain-containing protein